MVSLKRSFFYTLIIFSLLALIIFLVLYFAPKKENFKRTKINPAQYISKKEMIQQTAGSKKQQKKSPPKKKPVKKKQEKKKKITKKIKKPTKNKKENRSQQKEHKEKSSKKKEHRQQIPTIKEDKALKLPEQNDDLLSALATLPEAVEAEPRLSPQEEMLNEVYGDEITKLSTTAKQYLLDNHLKMQIITQKVLNRIGRIYIDPRFHYYDYNYIEFTLYPDGHISNIKVLKDAGFKLLDKITKETIETAYKDYPLPSEPTLVRYKFLYDLRSY